MGRITRPARSSSGKSGAKRRAEEHEMNDRRLSLAPRRSAMAVQVGLAALALGGAAVGAVAQTADPTVAELATPTSTVQVGVGTVNNAAAKASEYNGVSHKGPYGILDFDLRGGGAWDSDDATRWRVGGNNLGLQSRSLGAEYGTQGRYRLSLGIDELQRNRTDSYLTPYQTGSNVLTLPGTWQVPLVPRLSTVAPAAGVAGGANARGLSPDVTNSSALLTGVLTAPTAAQLATATAIQAADLPLFHRLDLSTKRTAYGIGITSQLGKNWQLTASLRQEDRKGFKPMSTVTRFTQADLATVIPDVIDQSTEQINVGATYVDERLVVNVAYYGSLFDNHVGSMSWANWAVPANVQTMSSAPSNAFHQLSVNSSYALTPATRLTGQVGYGRGTQDEAFLLGGGTPVVPATSLHGVVVTETAHLKLVSRATKQLTLAAAYKFENRDNRTPVNTYAFYDAGEIASTTASPFSAAFPGVTLGNNVNINANRPFSRRLNQLNVDADYAVARGHAIKVGGEYQMVDRSCSDTWISCTEAHKANESTLRAEWRFSAIENLEARVGLSAARRKVDYNENAFLALVPMANVAPTGAPGGATAYATLVALGLTGYGPVLGLNPQPPAGSAQAFYFPLNNALSNALYGNQNRISELPGMRRYDQADRNRDKLRSSLNWQASETVSLQAGVDLNDDRYSHSVYGLKRANGHAVNLDGTLTPTETLSLTLYATAEQQRSRSAGNTYTANSAVANVGGFTAISGGCFATIALRNANNKIDPCLDWSADMRDKVETLGLNFNHKALLAGKVDVGGGVSWSRARSDIGVTGGNYVNNPLAVAGAPAGTIAAYYIAATSLPTVKTDTLELKLNARYSLSKDTRIGVGYIWQHIKAEDWAYDGMQFGGLVGVLPTGERAPSFNVHTFMVTFIKSFQ
jgi:MtrB/PioB family decaheme-associated outer membrane protein